MVDFFSKEAGQNRRAWLDRLDRLLSEKVKYAAGPGLSDALFNTLRLGEAVSPAADVIDASEGSRQLMDAIRRRDARGGAYGAATLGAGLAGALLPGSVGAVDDAVTSLRPERLREAYQARFDQMALDKSDRIQPNPKRQRIVDEDYMTPPPDTAFEDLAASYPRNPTDGPLPKKDRARALVDQKEELGALLADAIRESGQMDQATRYFYHSDGPLYRAAKDAGLSDDEAAEWLNDFGQYVAATSPRTKVEENIRNATSAMAKDAAGIPHRTIVGPGSGGVSEKGYPMMTNKGGIHGILLDQVQSGGMDVTTNPKPFNFGNNLVGNRSGVTVDTHAIRGTLMTMNRNSPGSVPDGFILPKFKEKYAADPSTLTPDMIDDTLASQMVGPKGATTKMQTEYPVFADIFHEAADNLGVSPAEAQSMAWFGLGDKTNLGSAPQTLADIFDERLDVTSKALKIPPKEAARRVFNREIPLLSLLGGLGLGGAYMAGQGNDDDDRLY